MRWYIKTAPIIGTGTEDDPFRPDMSLYPTAKGWGIVDEKENYYVIKVLM